METHDWRVEWRYVLEEHGDLSVMTCGTTAMLPLRAVNWDSLELVRNLHHLLGENLFGKLKYKSTGTINPEGIFAAHSSNSQGIQDGWLACSSPYLLAKSTKSLLPHSTANSSYSQGIQDGCTLTTCENEKHLKVHNPRHC